MPPSPPSPPSPPPPLFPPPCGIAKQDTGSGYRVSGVSAGRPGTPPLPVSPPPQRPVPPPPSPPLFPPPCGTAKQDIGSGYRASGVSAGRPGTLPLPLSQPPRLPVPLSPPRVPSTSGVRTSWDGSVIVDWVSPPLSSQHGRPPPLVPPLSPSLSLTSRVPSGGTASYGVNAVAGQRGLCPRPPAPPVPLMSPGTSLPAGDSGGASSDAATGVSTFDMLSWPTDGSSRAERDDRSNCPNLVDVPSTLSGSRGLGVGAGHEGYSGCGSRQNVPPRQWCDWDAVFAQSFRKAARAGLVQNQSVEDEYGSKWFCELCQVHVSAAHLDAHLDSRRHQRVIDQRRVVEVLKERHCVGLLPPGVVLRETAWGGELWCGWCWKWATEEHLGTRKHANQLAWYKACESTCMENGRSASSERPPSINAVSSSSHQPWHGNTVTEGELCKAVWY